MKKEKTERAPRLNDVVTGRYQAAKRRGGYLVPDEAGITDIRVTEKGAGPALDGDQVAVRVYRSKPGRKPRGEVTTVLRRAHRQIAGRFERIGRTICLIPGNTKLDLVIKLDLKGFSPNKIRSGDWGVAEILEWPSDRISRLKGDLIEILGNEDQPGLPALLRLRKDGIECEFSEQVQEQALIISRQAIGKKDLESRKDLRGERIFTIDPLTAKDFDDAVQLIDSTGSGWIVGVHIADVGHYIEPGSAIDTEAYERATSIYPVDRVVPMLPESLSDHLCSLRPGEDKLTLGVSFRIKPDGKLDQVVLFESVIHSVRRFTYEDIQAFFDQSGHEKGTGKGELNSGGRKKQIEIPKALEDDLLELRKAARTLRQYRFERGALQLDLPDPEFVFDDSGTVTDLRRRGSHESHQLIEEFMIAANEAVSRKLEKSGYRPLFRVHEEPEDSAFTSIFPVLTRMGIRPPSNKMDIREQFNSILKQAESKPARNVIQRWILRVMMRAEYSHINIGHFGLASGSYVHFTSPIRRYPDLVNHRIVRAFLRGLKSSDPAVRKLTGNLEKTGRHTSRREKRAQKIEWDAQAIYSMQFMKNHLGSIFKGSICGVARMGLFVELVEYPVEGLIRIGMLEDDYYDFDEDCLLLRGRGRGRCFGIGDPVKVLIEKVNIMDGMMSLMLIEHGGNKSGRKTRRTG
jgi:ribonuclease R